MTRTSSRISLLLSAIGICLLSGIADASPVEVSISVFHEQLAPHGRWVSEPSYGEVWIPSGVASGWEPYVDGEWEYTDYGWTWVSEDPWGDVPYHYGTWASVDPYGWVWVPGTVWGPAWVTWAYTDDYVGWAPVPPSFALSARGYYGPAIVVPATRYIFVPAPRFVGVRVSTVRVPQTQSVTIFTRASKTTGFQVSNGIVRAQGPPVARIERAMGHKLERVPAQRLRVQPTTLSAGGMTGSRSIRVAAAPAAQGRTAQARKTTEARKTTDASKAAPARGRVSEPGRSGEKAAHSGEKAKAAPKRAESHARPASKSTPDHSGNPPREKSSGNPPRGNSSAADVHSSSGANAHPPAEPKAKASSATRETGARPPATNAHPPEHRPPPPPPPRKSSEEPKPKDKQPPGTR